MHSHRAIVALITGTVITFATERPSIAAPREGALAPNARLEDADGRVLEIKSIRGRPMLIVYEDQDATKQNRVLKDELATLAKGELYRATVVMAAVADVQGYDFWPVRGFVRNAIRDESRKFGTPIYCDWTGAFRATYNLRRGVSNIVLVGRDGRVRFSSEGTLDDRDRRRLLGLLRVEVQ